MTSDHTLTHRYASLGYRHEEIEDKLRERADQVRWDAKEASMRRQSTHYRVDFEARPVLLDLAPARHSYVVEAENLSGAVFSARNLAAKRELVTTRILHAAAIDPDVSSDWGKLS